MNGEAVILKAQFGARKIDAPGVRVAFSAHQCFMFDGGAEDLRCLEALGRHLGELDGLALYGDGPLVEYLLEHIPVLQNNVICLISDADPAPDERFGIKCAGPNDFPPEVTNVFLCETLAFPRMQMRKRLQEKVNVIEPDILWKLQPEAVPTRAWVSLEQNIYPINIPDIKFEEGMDLLLIDCPSRNLSMMPNGLGYVHNALKKTSINFQTLDLDIIVYHRYHIHRLFDMGGKIVLPNGIEAPTDPWLAENYDFWAMGSKHEYHREGANEVLEFFSPIIDEIVNAIVKAKPKTLGLSIQQCNEAFSREVVNGVKRQLPEVNVIVGGYSCYNPDIGRRAFPESDYMFIGEAELTVGPVLEAIVRGEKPFNQPGVLSRFDSPDYQYIPGPVPHNIDQIEFPKYEWFDDLSIYRNYNGYQLTPIIASRGCRWSRCTFCAERFYWRIRSAPNFVEELQWLIDQGCHLFMFNESDLNGMPEKVVEICDEIITRGLHKKAKLTGQLRIHKKSTRAFFDKLKAANVVALRFGVDAFSGNTLRLQKKGYTVEMVSQNLKDCWEAGIYTEVNWVIGVPGEAEQDIEDGIELILKNQQYIGRIANINPLIMVNGSVYWIDPDRYNIVFREPKEKLYHEYPRAMPADKWYSVNPYIDAQVRKERFEQIVLALYEAGFPVGAWANRIIEDVKLARDKMRAGGAHGDKLRQIDDEATQEEVPVHKTIDLQIVSPEEELKINIELPREIQVTDTHKIIHYLDWFYAIPRMLGEIDLATCDMSSLDGVIRAPSESDLMNMLEESASWANSRGHYNPQKKQREEGGFYRAGSFCGAMASRPLEFKPVIVLFDEQYYALREEDWDSLNKGKAPANATLMGSGDTRQGGAIIIPGSSFDRRLARRLLPMNLQIELRRIVHTAKYEDSEANKPLPHFSSKKLLTLLLKGCWREFVVRPLKDRLSRGKRRSTDKGVRIIGVISKGASPELMWTVENYNIVKFDNVFYALPHGMHVDWASGAVSSMPGALASKILKVVVDELDELLGGRAKSSAYDNVFQTLVTKGSGPSDEHSRVPMLLGSLKNYNIVSYEGWVYGIPQALGDVDLMEIDIMETPGVIRDVSRDVVENEIIENAGTGEAVA